MVRQKLLLVLVAMLVAVSVAQVSFAADKTKHVVTQQQANVPTVDELAKKEAENRAVGRLTAHEWEVVFTPREKKHKSFSDVLTFTPVTMIAKSLSEKGYSASNYAISVMRDGTGVWQTVSSNNLGEYGSWRGEVIGTTQMRGTVSFKFKTGREIYDFASVTPAVVAVPVVPAATLSSVPAKE